MTGPTELLTRTLAIRPSSLEERTLRLILELGTELVGAEEGSLLVLDEETDELVLAMTVGSQESEATLRGQRVPVGQGITGLAVLTRSVQVGSTTYTDIQQSQHRDADHKGPTAVVAAPLLAGDLVVGAITGVSFQPDKRFGGKDADRYARFASIAGVVVDQRRRLAMVDPTTEEDWFETGSGGPAESQLVQRVGRLVQNHPESLDHLNRLLEAVECLVDGPAVGLP